MGAHPAHRDAPTLGVVFAAALLLVGGCTRTEVVVEMKPAGDGFERRVAAYDLDLADSLARHRPPHLDAALAARLARVYGVRADTLRPYAAARRFTTVPEDVGNWGRWTVDRSPLGDSFRYLERIGGDPDPQATLARRLAAADSIAAWLRAWSVSASGPPARSRLAGYLEREFAHDLRNLAALHWTRAATVDTNVRALLEVDQAEHAVAYDLWMATAEATPLMLLTCPPPHDSVAAALHDSMLAFLESALSSAGGRRHAARVGIERDSLRARVGRYERVVRPDATADSARWGAAHERLGTSASLFEDESGSDRLEVRLATGVEPIESNGAWDAASGVVSWVSDAPRAAGGRLPLACQARWAMPDSARQRALFGHVLLRDDALAGYCTWYAGQPRPRQAEWDRMLLALRPGDLGPLERFAFASERAAADSTRGSDAALARELILEAARPAP